MASYDDLLRRQDAPPGSSWGIFRADLGTLDRLTAASVLNGVGSVRSGDVFNLDYTVDAFDPPISKIRTTPQHTIYSLHRDHRDERLDSFYPQVGSQIDGLRHRRHGVHGFYDAVPDGDIVAGQPRLGIQAWSQHGIIGRGLLVDVERHVAERGEPFDHHKSNAITPELLDATLRAQQSVVRPGDILLIRTGWARFYLNDLDPHERAAMAKHPRSTGLIQSRGMLAWLWDNEVAMVAADNVAVEVLPADESSPFQSDTDGGLMHPELIALLGLALGELWDLERLADAASTDRRYDCLLSAKPLNIVGGVGSTANAMAIR